MTKLNKNKLSGQEFFSLEEISNLLEDEKENIGQYIKEGSLKIGKDLKVHKDDFAALINHILDKSQTKQKKFTPRIIFVILWLATIASFIFTLNGSNSNYKPVSAVSGGVIIGNIGLGVMFFLAILLPKRLIKKSENIKISRYILLVAVIYFFLYVAVITTNGSGLIASFISQSKNPVIQNTSKVSQEVDWEQEIVSEINKTRDANKLDPLSENDLLQKSSTDRAQYMIENNSWEISPESGKDYKYFIKESGYKYNYAAESTAKNFSNPSSVVTSLMADKINKDNILSENFKDIGVAVKDGMLSGQKTKVVVIHFGSLAALAAPAAVINKNIQTIDSDPIIDCESSYPNCKGSSIKVHQSQCSKITCCQVGNNWSIYPTKDKCDEAQKNNQPQQVAAPPTTQRTQGNNTYCWDNASSYGYYTSSGDQCNLDNAKSLTYKICMGTQKMKSDSCNSTCKNKLDQDNAACAWAYTGANAGIVQSSDKYGECLNGPGGTGEAYGTCLGKCTDQYTQDIKQCTY